MTAVPRPVGPQSDTGPTAPMAAPARHGARVGGTAVRRYDPAAMAPTARIAELGAILAAGYRRLRLNRQNCLAASRESEPSCDQTVDSAENDEEAA